MDITRIHDDESDSEDENDEYETKTESETESERENARLLLQIQVGVNSGEHIKSVLKSIRNDFYENDSELFDSRVENYVEYKYMEFLCKRFVSETTELIRYLNTDELIRLMSQAESCFDLKDFPPFFKSIKSFKLILESGLVKSKKEIQFVLKLWKKTFITSAVQRCASLKNEMEFLNEFVSFLTNPTVQFHKKEIFQDIVFHSSGRSKDLFERIFSNIESINASTLIDIVSRLELKAVALGLQIKASILEDNVLSDYFREKLELIVQKYTEPPKINKLPNGVFQIIGTYLDLAEAINLLDNEPDIKEVQVITPDVVIINLGLERNVWGGRNFAICTKKIIVTKPVSWDLSGKDVVEIMKPPKNGVEFGENGEDGDDGKSGESGGNILIIADTIVNPSLWEIKSNGGKGGKGHAGGNGAAGKNGRNGDDETMEPMTMEKFKRLFPEIRWDGENSTEAVDTCIQSVRDLSDTIEKENIQRDSTPLLMGLRVLWADVYIFGKSKLGADVVYGFHQDVQGYRSAHAWYTGAPGEAGGFGGLGGRSGRGGFWGYAGEIVIKTNDHSGSEVTKVGINGYKGRDGDAGKSGSNGKNGKPGKDFVYADPCVSVGWKNAPVIYESGINFVKRYTEENMANRWLNEGANLLAKVFTLGYAQPELSTDKHFYCTFKQKWAYFEDTGKAREQVIASQERNVQNSRRKVPDAEKKSVVQESALKQQFDQNNAMTQKFNANITDNKINDVQEMASKLQEERESQIGYSGIRRTCEYENQFRNPSAPRRRKIDPSLEVEPKPKIRQKVQLFNNMTKRVENLVRDKKTLSSEETGVFFEELRVIVESWKYNVMDRESFSLLDLYQNKMPKLCADLMKNPLYTCLLNLLSSKCLIDALERSKSKLDSQERVKPTFKKRYFMEKTVNDSSDGIWHALFGSRNACGFYVCKNSQFYKEKFPEKLMRELRDGAGSFWRLYAESIMEADWDDLHNTASDQLEMVTNLIRDERIWKWFLRNYFKQASLLKVLFELLPHERIVPPVTISRSSFQEILKRYIFNVLDSKNGGGDELNELSTFKNNLKIYLKQLDVGTTCENIRKLISTPEFVKSYTTFVLNNGFNPPDFNLLAHLYQIHIQTFVYDDAESSDRLKMLDSFNPTNSAACHSIQIKDFEYCRVGVSEKCVAGNECKIIANFLAKAKSCDFADAKSVEKLKNLWMYPETTMMATSNNTVSFDDETIEQLLVQNEQWGAARLLLVMIGSKCHAVLGALQARFEQEYCQIDAYVLTQLSLGIMRSEPEFLPMFEWIILGCPQTEWIDELALMTIQDLIGNQLCYDSIPRWRNLLKKRTDKSMLKVLLTKISESRHETPTAVLVNEILELSSSHFLDSLEAFEFEELLDVPLANWFIKLKQFILVGQLRHVFDSGAYSKNFAQCLYYSSSLQNEHENFFADFLDLLLQIKNGNTFVLEKCLSNFYHEIWTPSDEGLEILQNIFHGVQRRDILESWAKTLDSMSSNDDSQRDLGTVLNLIEKSLDSSFPANNLNQIKEICKKSYPKLMKQNEKSWTNWLGKSVSTLLQNVLVQETEQSLKARLKTLNYQQMLLHELIPLVDAGIRIKRNFSLKATQIVAIASLLTGDKGTLAQVATGEGKSLIVLACCIIRGLKGEKTDVITSSSILAQRDAEINADIYDLFEISVGHNSSEDEVVRKEEYAKDVVYGDVGSFQRDYLLNKFFEKNILGARTNMSGINVVIDEVDSMLLDKGDNVLYLSHQPGGFEVLEPIFIMIWKQINYMFAQGGADIDVNKLKITILSQIYSLVTKSELKSVNEADADALWENLITNGVIDSNGRVITGEPALPENLKQHTSRLTYLFRKNISSEKSLAVPEHLKPFVALHLDSWISSAIQAMLLSQGREYIVDVPQRSFSTLDRNPRVIILDRDTGVDQNQSQWNEALHQFLQMKHECKVSVPSLKAIFISNVSYFKCYKTISGLTGTLGSQVERNVLKNIYNINFLNIPLSQKKRFTQDVPELFNDRLKWRDRIVKSAMNKSGSEHRSVLIICESVKDAEFINSGFPTSLNTYVYKRSYEEFEITSGNQELEPGKIIISTNLAGRGTDIKISKDLKKYGGLHVCLTFLPNNIRVEQQAFGRAARKGDPGSGQLIIYDRNVNIGSEASDVLTTLDLKIERDDSEFNRLSKIQQHFDNVVTVEEDLFKEFARLYEDLQVQLGKLNMSNFFAQFGCAGDIVDKITKFPSLFESKCLESIKTLILQSFVDKWAFWLDRAVKTELCTNKTFTDREKLFSDLQGTLASTGSSSHRLSAFYSNAIALIINPVLFFAANPLFAKNLLFELDTLVTSILPTIVDTPPQIFKLGKIFLENKDWEKAILHFDKVIASGTGATATFAKYYKALAVSKTAGIRTTEFKRLLLLAETELKQLIDFEMRNIAIVKDISKRLHCKSSTGVPDIESYEEQKTNLINLYQIYLQSISDIFGHEVTPSGLLVGNMDFKMAEQLIEYLQELDYLRPIKIRRYLSIYENSLKTIASEYGIQYENLCSIIRDMRVGLPNNIEGIHNCLKGKVKFPTRQDFWNKLKNFKIISEEKILAVLLKKSDESDYRFQQLKKSNIFIEFRSRDLTGNVCFDSGLTSAIVECCPLKECDVKNEIVQKLISTKSIQVCKVARFNPDIKCELTDYNRIDSKNMIRYVDSPTAKIIEEFLNDQKMIDSDGILLHGDLEDESKVW